MTITVNLRPDVQAELARQAAAHGSPIEDYAAVLLEEAVNPSAPLPSKSVLDAIERLKIFGESHGLSLGDTTIRELRHEARP